jgi:anti-sigma B factor antagonist
MAALDLQTHMEGPVAVVAARGELDLAAGGPLADELRRAADLPGVEAVLLDLSALEFMDSSGLRSVVAADRTVQEQGRRFALVRGGDPVHRVFEITRMAERLTWVGSAKELA